MEKIIIGQKMTRKGVFANFLVLSIFGLLSAFGPYHVFMSYLKISSSAYLVFAVIAYSVTMLVLLPIIGSSETLEFSQDKVCHFQAQGYLKQMEEILRVLKNGKEIPDGEIKIEHIDKVSLSYVSVLSMRALKMYKFKMSFLLKDGTYIYYFPTSVDQMKNGDYERVLSLFEEKEIEIVDKYHIRPALSMDTQGYFDYIDQIDKKRRSL